MKTITCAYCGSDRPYGKACPCCPHGDPSAFELLMARFHEAARRPRFSESRFLSKEGVGRNLGIRPDEVDRLIREGHLRSVPHGKREVIPASELPKFDITGIPPPGAGRPPSKQQVRGNGTARTLEEEVRAVRAIRIPRD